MNYWNNGDPMSSATEVTNILQNLEQDTYARGNVDPNQYKIVLQNLLSNYHRRHFSGGSLGADATFLQNDGSIQQRHSNKKAMNLEARRKDSTMCMAGGQITLQDIKQDDRTQSRLRDSEANSYRLATSPDFKPKRTTDHDQSLGQPKLHISRSRQSRTNFLNHLTSNNTMESMEPDGARDDHMDDQRTNEDDIDQQETAPELAGSQNIEEND